MCFCFQTHFPLWNYLHFMYFIEIILLAGYFFLWYSITTFAQLRNLSSLFFWLRLETQEPDQNNTSGLLEKCTKGKREKEWVEKRLNVSHLLQAYNFSPSACVEAAWGKPFYPDEAFLTASSLRRAASEANTAGAFFFPFLFFFLFRKG